MKKVLASGLAVSILLAGCGGNTNSNKSTEQTNKTVSKKEAKKYIQKQVDELGLSMQDFYHINNAETIDVNALLATKDGLESNTKEFSKFVDNNKLPADYKKFSNNLISFSNSIITFYKEYTQAIKDYRNKKLTDSQLENKVNELAQIIDKDIEKIDNKEFDSFVEKEKIDTSKIDAVEEYDKANQSSPTDSETTSFNPVDGFKSKKTVDTKQSVNIGPIILNINKVELGTIKVTKDNEYNFESTKAGQEAQIIILHVKMKNTKDTNVEYYADQFPITTNTGEQLDPSLLTNSDLITEMKGDVESSGKIIYELKNSKIDDINSIEYITQSYNDPETMDEIAPEQKIELKLK